MYIIYMHTCTITNKSYIGLTKYTIEERFEGHVKSSEKPKFHFHRAIKKYGRDSFVSEILESGIDTLDKANEREQFFISKYDTFHNGYNMTIGGDTLYSSTKGKTYEEIYGEELARKKKEHLRCLYKNRYISDSWRENMKKNHWSTYRCAFSKKNIVFLLPDGEILYREEIEDSDEINIPSSLFKKHLYMDGDAHRSSADGWSYLVVDEYQDKESYRSKLIEISISFWEDKLDPKYKYVRKMDRMLPVCILCGNNIIEYEKRCSYFCKTCETTEIAFKFYRNKSFFIEQMKYVSIEESMRRLKLYKDVRFQKFMNPLKNLSYMRTFKSVGVIRDVINKLCKFEYNSFEEIGMDNNQIRKMYYSFRGYSEKESEDKITFIQRERSQRCVEYWTKGGFSLDEAKKQVSFNQKRKKNEN